MIVHDGLSSLISGIGTSADKRMAQHYAICPLSWPQIEARYRSSWLARKVIDLPPSEMCRPKRNWQADGTDITALEEAERKLGLWAKLEEALALARMGGSVLVIGAGNGDVAQPLNPLSVRKDGLKYLHVMSRHDVSLGEIDLDPGSENFGKPGYYEVLGNSSMVRLHPSRVIPFKGVRVPQRGYSDTQSFWGDSVLDACDDAIRNADSAQNNLAALIEEAKVDIWGIPDLTQSFLTPEYEQALMRRFTASNTMKSIHNAVVKDAQDTWETRQLSLSGLPEVMMAYIGIVAGAASMPATVLLGKSPDGMNATGDGDLQNWERTIDGWRESQLRPALDYLDEILVRSALGDKPADVWWDFGPLRERSPTEVITEETARATLVKTLIDAGAPQEPLLKAMGNAVVEAAVLPGFEDELAEYEKQLEEMEAEEVPEEQAGLTQGSGMAMDSIPGAVKWLKKAIALHEHHMNGEKPTTGKAGEKSQMLMMEQMKKALAELEGGGMKSGMKGMAANDAAPRPLYVSRKVKNVADLKAWAKSQGLPELQDDLHVTVAFSRKSVDWIKMGQDYRDFSGKGTGELIVAAGGPRVVEPLGDRTAVLMFANSDLSWRNREMRDLGASWDYEDYQPHISLTGDPVDLSNVEPYRGKIVLGPEIFEDLNID